MGAGCPAIGFTPVVENVEDLQIAYVFRDGTIWNSLGNPATKPGAIPGQIATGTATPGATDVSNVRALRVSVDRAVESARHRGPAALRRPSSDSRSDSGGDRHAARRSLSEARAGRPPGGSDRHGCDWSVRPLPAHDDAGSQEPDAGVLTMRGRRITRAGAERGGALIIVLLVVLVLTIVGIGVAYFTQLEDQSSGNIRLTKTAFYAGETGLRTGEVELTQANATGTAASDLLRTAGARRSPFRAAGPRGFPSSSTRSASTRS